MKIDKEDLLARFLRYVQIDTQSDATSSTFPSTQKQWDLLYLLERELKELGIEDVKVTKSGYVLATIHPTSTKENVPQIAFLAHVDTADACPGLAKPIVHRNYDGNPIVLPDDPSKILNTDEIPLLKEKIGKDIITASGKTLLGADDKAGVAIIMSFAKYLVEHKEVLHGPIRICFNPDEEIGKGMQHISLEELGARAAYTLDSEHLGEINYETFSADQAVIEVHGIASHPGSAKGVMVNALKLASAVINALPKGISPEHTEGRDGFIHPTDYKGTSEKAVLKFILRDFELDGLEAKRETLRQIVKNLQDEEPLAKWKITFHSQYRNMRYYLDKDPFVIEAAKKAVSKAGLVPFSEPVRGGTDGAHLTERGLPTPNIFTGFHNIHSEKEWICLQDMEHAVKTLIHLVQIWEQEVL